MRDSAWVERLRAMGASTTRTSPGLSMTGSGVWAGDGEGVRSTIEMVLLCMRVSGWMMDIWRERW